MAYSEIQSAFNAGELSPNLYSRVDLAKFESGAALIRNFTVNYQGGVSYRPGTRFIVAAKDFTQPPRLLPFIVSTEASYVLEFGDLYIRYINRGVQLEASPGVAYETTTPYAYSDLPLLKFTQSADVLTIVHPAYPPANLTRTSDTTFSYAAIAIGPTIQPPVFSDVTATNGGNFFYGYVVTAVDLNGKEESLSSDPGVDVSEILDETTGKVFRLLWTPPSQPVSVYNIYKWGPIEDTSDPASVWGLIGSSKTTTFIDNNIAPDFSKEPPRWGDPFSGGQFESINVDDAGTGYVDGNNGWSDIPYVPLIITGDGTDAAGYATIEEASGTVTGVYLTNTGKNYTVAGVTAITANGEGGTGATFDFTLSDIAPLYPSCVAYIQQRQVFGGSDLKPETLVFSNIGRYTNFNTTPVSLDSDAIVVSLASQEVNTIKALVPTSAGLLAFTSGGSFLLNGGTPGAAITPSSITAQPQAYTGSNDVAPLRVEFDVLYIQGKGNRVRNLSFNWQRQSYTGSDISALAAHLFDNFQIVEWCWAQEPFKLAWAVRDDGRLLSLTYVPDQEVYAWARHDTQGLFKSICTIPEGDVDAVYVTVSRWTGTCWHAFIERMDNRLSDCILDAWHVDSGASLASTSPDAPLYLDTPLQGPVAITAYDPCGTVPTAPSGPFSAMTAGDVIRVGYGEVVVTDILTDYTLQGWLAKPWIDVLPDDVTVPIPVPAGDWSYTTPSSTLTGLSHLEGLTVWALADGKVVGPKVVSGGAISLGVPSVTAVGGLLYTGQVKTLYLTVDGLSAGSIQGKRKFAPAVTLRVDGARGCYAGHTFDTLTPVQDLIPRGTDIEPFFGDARHLLGGLWDLKGEICIQQSVPLPANISGVIIEVVPGDTGR